MADLDTLSIDIQTNASSACKAINKLALSLDNLSVAIAKIETGKLNDLASGLNNLNFVVQNMSGKSNTWDFKSIASNIGSLANINTSGLNNLATSLGVVSNAINNISITDTVVENVKNFASTIGKLGSKSIGNAITNLPQLESAISSLFTTFSKVPEINQNVIEFINSITNLASQGQHTGSAIHGIDNALERFGTTTARVTRRSHSLASVIGTLYAKFWIFMRGARALKDSFISAADYLEAFNYFDVTARKIGKDTFAKAGVGSAEEYAQAFNDTLQEKLHKMSGLELDLESRLIKTTNAKSLGLNLTELTQYQASIASITNAMGVSQGVAESTAKAFSMLAGDMGSLKNMDFEQVAQKLQSGLVGQSRALYAFGIDITNATLEQYALNEGIKKSVSEMSQSEKAQLRLLAILDQSKVAWGDLANTINSPSNQLRMLQNNLKEVGTVLGQLFIPIMESALPVINGLSLAIKQLLVDIAELLGIELNLDSFGQFGDDINADIEGMEELNKAVEKTKKGIRDFDELKVISSGKGKNTDAGNQIDLTKQIIDATAEYEKVWDEAYARMTNKASEIAAYISGAFEPIKNIIEDFAIGDFFKAGEDVSNLVISIFDFIADAIAQVDWTGLGKKIGDFLSGINWLDILKSLGNIVGNALQGAINLWQGAFDVAPFETAIITAFALLKFTGLGDFVKVSIGNILKSELSETKLSKLMVQKLGLGAISVGVGIALTVDNITDIKEGHYNPFDVQSVIKSLVSAVFVGAGFSLMATAIGIASGGLAFGIGAAITLGVNLFVGLAEMQTPYEQAQKVVAEENSWIDEYNLKAMEIQTDIELRGTITKESLDNIDQLAKDVWELSQNYDDLTAVQKGWLKEYSDQLKQAVPGIADSIDEITGAYRGTKEELQKLIDKEKEQIVLESYRQNLTDVTSALNTAKQTKDTIQTQMMNNAIVRDSLRQQLKNELGDDYSEDMYQYLVERIKSGDRSLEGFWETKDFAKKNRVNLKLSKSETYNNLVNALAQQEDLNKKFVETSNVITNLTSQQQYWLGEMSKSFEETFSNITPVVEEGIDGSVEIIEKQQLPNSMHNSLKKVIETIETDGSVSEYDMKTLFSNINTSFAGLGDGEVPSEVQRTMDNIKLAIVNNSPELINYMKLLKQQMVDAFLNEKVYILDSGEFLYNQNGIGERLYKDVGKLEEGTYNNGDIRKNLTGLKSDLLELFGGEELPTEVNKAYEKLANTINQGKGQKAVLNAIDDFKSRIGVLAHDSGIYFDFGLGTGVWDGSNYFYTSLEDMYKGGVTVTKDYNEINSPSHLYERLAESIPEGAALGVRKGIPQVEYAVEAMSNAIRSTWGNVEYNVPSLGLGYRNSQNGFNYGTMDSSNGFISQMVNMANMGAQNGQAEVVFRVEGDPYGIFKVVREENDRYRNRTHRSAFN